MRPVDIGTTPVGHRMNLELEGDTDPDSRLQGHLTGVDYLTVRSDGVLDLNVHATLRRPEGGVVALRGSGLATRTPDGAARGQLALRFETAAEDLAFLNQTLGIAVTTADMTRGTLHISGFSLVDD
jgi:hypothetical protein